MNRQTDKVIRLGIPTGRGVKALEKQALACTKFQQNFIKRQRKLRTKKIFRDAVYILSYVILGIISLTGLVILASLF